eukprot:1188382-Prorocentrum_minimum.AAC.1
MAPGMASGKAKATPLGPLADVAVGSWQLVEQWGAVGNEQLGGLTVGVFLKGVCHYTLRVCQRTLRWKDSIRQDVATFHRTHKSLGYSPIESPLNEISVAAAGRYGRLPELP